LIYRHNKATKPRIKTKGGGQGHLASIDPHKRMCNNTHMATNLALDDRLIEEARRVGRHKTKREAVSAALAEYVKRRKQLRILDAFGTVDFDPKYDYKTERRRKRP
jgi:Arc/MetJ family transcription regulator